MSRTYRKFPIRIDSEYHDEAMRDGHEWHAPKSVKKFVKRNLNRRDRREWLSNTERHKLASRERFIWF